MKSKMKWSIRSLCKWIFRESRKRHAILLPLRIFIGLGWLRASVEKLIDPDWHSGVALEHFFLERITEGDVAFPFYQLLMEGLYSAHAPMLGNLIILGEFYCGIALLFGLFTRPALLAGIFMNLNFILAGVVNPSAFYVVIQLIMLPSAVGRVYGLDSLFVRTRSVVAGAPSKRRISERAKMVLYVGCGLACGLLAIPIVHHVQTVDPARSVEDPAMLLLILLAMLGLLLLILGGQTMRRDVYRWDKTTELAFGRGPSPIVGSYPLPEQVTRRPSTGWAQDTRARQGRVPQNLNPPRDLVAPSTIIQFAGYRVGQLQHSTQAVGIKSVSRATN